MSKMAKRDQNQFIAEGKLDMVKVLEKFVEYFHDIYGENDEKFMEAYGRKFFLLYLKQQLFEYVPGLLLLLHILFEQLNLH